MKARIFTLLILLCGVALNAQPHLDENESYERTAGLKKEKLFNIELTSLDRKDLLLEDITLQGKTVVFAFFAHWCAPCQAELDTLNKLREKWARDYNAEVVAVTLDSKKDMKKVEDLISAKGWGFRVVWDETGQAKSQLRIRNVPQMMVVNNEGYKVYESTGYEPENLPYLEGILKLVK